MTMSRKQYYGIVVWVSFKIYYTGIYVVILYGYTVYVYKHIYIYIYIYIYIIQ